MRLSCILIAWCSGRLPAASWLAGHHKLQHSWRQETALRRLTARWLARQSARHREDRAARLPDHSELLEAQLVCQLRDDAFEETA